MEPTEAAITASKAVGVMDHIKNHRIEYLLLAGLAHILGWLNEFKRVAAGVCA